MLPLLLAALLLGCHDQPAFFESDGDFESEEDCLYEGAPDGDFAAALAPSGCQYRITAVGENVRILLDVPVFAEALTAGSGAATYTLPDDDVRLLVEVGCALEEGWCGVDGTASILDTYEPTAGTITVSAAGDDTTGDVLATVSLEGVTLENAGGVLLAMDPLTWSDVRLHGIDE